MSKSKRVFLTIMGDDDFWGNGDGIDSSSTTPSQSIVTTTTTTNTMAISGATIGDDDKSRGDLKDRHVIDEGEGDDEEEDGEEEDDFEDVEKLKSRFEKIGDANGDIGQPDSAYYFKGSLKTPSPPSVDDNDDLEFHSCDETIGTKCVNAKKFERMKLRSTSESTTSRNDSGKDDESLMVSTTLSPPTNVKTDKTFSDDDDNHHHHHRLTRGAKRLRRKAKGLDHDDDEDDEDDDLEENKSDQKDSGAASIESNDTYHNGFRNFLQNRPESEIRAFIEGPFQLIDDKFFEAYEIVRRELENSPHSHVVQQLRRSLPSVNAQRYRSKHAVVVSSFREPDRRLGRYSKYYYHHNVGPEVYSRKVFVGGLPACVSEVEILMFFSRFGRLQVDWPSKHYVFKSDSDPSMISGFGGGVGSGGGGNDHHHHHSHHSHHHHYHGASSTTMTSMPTSHLAQVSPPFGQINPFVTSSSVDCQSQMDVSLSAQSIRDKKQQHPGYVFLLFEKERSVRDLVAECYEEEEGLFILMDAFSSTDAVRVQIRPWLLADAEFLMDFNVPINTKLVAFIGGVPRPLKAVELAHFFEQTYGHVVCVGIDIDNKFKYPRGSGRVAFSNYEAYVQAITDRYIVLDHEDIHKRVEIKPYFFHNQSCEECSGRYHRQHAPFFCPSLECFQYYCEPCWHKMHAHPSRLHHVPVIKGV